MLRAYASRPRVPDASRVTAAAGMTRKSALLSHVERSPWTENGSVESAFVDGEPVTAQIPDLPRDLLLVALEGLPGALACGVLALLRVAWAVDRDIVVSVSDGARFLARTRSGEYRTPLPGDMERFQRATSELAALQAHDPRDGVMWFDMAHVEARMLVDGSWSVIIGPPAWRNDLMRSKIGGRWTLTADGGRMARARIAASADGSPAGRIVTGIEHRLAARFDGKPGIAPDLRPARGKTGSGPVVFLSWRDVLYMAGFAWDRADKRADRATHRVWQRAREKLKATGYLLANPSDEAKAGDSVEIVGFVRAGRGREAGVGIRASARFVEAARLANRRDGRGFSTVALAEFLGLDV